MKRADALGAIKVAGYHGDSRTAVQLYVRHNISLPSYRRAFAEGEAARAAGVPCGCVECARMTPRPAGAGAAA